MADLEGLVGCLGEELVCSGQLLERPPDFMQLPPPPVPEFMREYVQRLQQNTDDCLLCDWAGHNDSLLLIGAESGSTSSWIPILVAVALVSALLGAILMVICYKCRRWRVIPSKGLCPLSMDRSKEPSTQPADAKQPARHAGLSGQRAPPPGGWALKFWRRSTSQDQHLRSPSSAADSELSFEEQPYTFPDQESAVYAELNSVAPSHGVPAYRTYMLNTYSEVVEPRRLLPDGTYENGGYLLEPLGGGESGGSGSNHSSAYYSDISSGGGDNSGRGSQQRRAQRRHRGVMSVSERVPALTTPVLTPAAYHLGSGGRMLLHRHLPLPVIGVLPDNMENPPPESTVIATARRGSRYSRTLPPACSESPSAAAAGLHLAPNLSMVRCPVRSSRGYSFRAVVEPGQRSGDSGNRSGSDQGSMDGHRPLPLLPSRRAQGPQKRGVYTLASSAGQHSPLPPESSSSGHSSQFV